MLNSLGYSPGSLPNGPSKRIRLRVRKQSAWTSIPLDHRRAAVDISLANPKCAGEFLERQLLWARERFRTFDFSIGDTLSVHNYVSLGHPTLGRLLEGDARNTALAEGDVWLESNLPIIQSILAGAPVTVRRWDDWMTNEHVVANLAWLCHMYSVVDEFRAAVAMYVGRFLARRGVMGESLTETDRERLDRYILEELSVYQYQVEVDRAVNLYPGDDLAVYQPLAMITCLPTSLRERQYIVFGLK